MLTKFYQKGEIALTLTLVSLFLLVMGIFAGTKLAQKQTQVNTQAQQAPTLRTQATTSQSDLGIVILNDFTQNAQQIIAAKPKVIKIVVSPPTCGPPCPDYQPEVDRFKKLLSIAKTYKTQVPDGIAVLRIFTQPGPCFDTDGCGDPKAVKKPSLPDPVISARQYYGGNFDGTDYGAGQIKPIIDAINTDTQVKEYFHKFDYLESPNEAEQITDWSSNERVDWLAKFWDELSRIYREKAEIGTCVSISNGDLGNTDTTPPQTIESHVKIFAPTLRKLKERSGAWCYHAFFTKNIEKLKGATPDLGEENWYSLRFKQFYNAFNVYPELNDLKSFPIILSEAGIDVLGNPTTGGWKAILNNDGKKYMDYLRWFDTQIKPISYVKGAAIWEIGDPQSWSSYDLDPIAADFASYLSSALGSGGSGGATATPIPTGGGSGNNSGGGGGGGGAGGGGNASPSNPGGTIQINVYKVDSSGRKSPWSTADGKAQVYISGRTATGGFSEVMDVPSTTGTCYTDPKFNAGATAGYPFRCDPAIIYWAGTPPDASGNYPGTAVGSYSIQISSLPACTPPNCLAPSPYPNPAVSVVAGGTTKTELDIVASQTAFNPSGPSPTQAAAPAGYTNADYNQIILQYTKEQISPLTVSQWLSQATRVPGLQKAVCYPPNCEFNQ